MPTSPGGRSFLTEHGVELDLLTRHRRIGQRGGEALAFDGALVVALDHLRRLNAHQLVDGRDDVDGMDVLVAYRFLEVRTRPKV